jgi:hypothetical protein
VEVTSDHELLNVLNTIVDKSMAFLRATGAMIL